MIFRCSRKELIISANVQAYAKFAGGKMCAQAPTSGLLGVGRNSFERKGFSVMRFIFILS